MRQAARVLLASVLAPWAWSPAAQAEDAQAHPDLSTQDYTDASINLSGDAATLDWVKWGYPSVDQDDGPFSAQELAARATVNAKNPLRQTRKADGSHPIGMLSAVLPSGASTDEPYWSYLRTGAARFKWTDGDLVASSPSDLEVSGGMALLPAMTPPGHSGWGFELQVAATPALRFLDLYFDCPPDPSQPNEPPITSGLVRAQLGTLPTSTTRVCFDQTRRVQKVRVSFSTASDIARGSVTVGITTEDQVGLGRPIVLLATTLQEASKGDAGVLEGPLADRPTACAVIAGTSSEPALMVAGGAGVIAVMRTRRRRAR